MPHEAFSQFLMGSFGWEFQGGKKGCAANYYPRQNLSSIGPLGMVGGASMSTAAGAPSVHCETHW